MHKTMTNSNSPKEFNLDQAIQEVNLSELNDGSQLEDDFQFDSDFKINDTTNMSKKKNFSLNFSEVNKNEC